MPNIERIKLYESYLDESNAALSKLFAALERYAAVMPKIAALKMYYDTDWQTDYLDDEQGLLPPDLKRGVLTEDAIFDLLSSDEALRERVRELFPCK